MSMGIVIVTIGLAVSASAADIDPAIELFRAGQYRQALALLDGSLADSQLADTDRVRALEYHAYCLFALELYPQARDAWRALRRLAPMQTVDPNKVSPEFVSFFRRVEDTPIVAPVDISETAAQSTRCAPLLCAVPFGTGQLVNRRIIKGSVFMAVEALALAANLGMYWAQSPTEPPSDAYELLQHGALGVFVLTAVVGVLDAYLMP